MSTQHTAEVYVLNNLEGTAKIEFSHRYSGNPVEKMSGTVASGDSLGPLQVRFETGVDSWFDYWFCAAEVIDGPNVGNYVTEGSPENPAKECMLRSEDASTTITNTVDLQNYSIILTSGTCETPMVPMPLPPVHKPVTQVFLLMLENHSFDNLLGYVNIPGVYGVAGDTWSNTYDSVKYSVQEGAVNPMTTDPGHEFLDVLEQLCGAGVANPFATNPDARYPLVVNSGYVTNYATAADTGTGTPAAAHFGDVMLCANPASQLPVLNQLALEFAVCDEWYSSMPGPTWPNRFFAMGASSSGLDNSPSAKQMAKWEIPSGFEYMNGSIFQLLNSHDKQFRLYNDFSDDYAQPRDPTGGGWAICAALKELSMFDVHHFYGIGADLNAFYPYVFTLIEPNYGNVENDTYKGGSSQHPMDTFAAGEALIARLYNVLRNSPLWDTSLLIITYDEHGGFYDHRDPPAAAPPGDKPTYGLNTCGFNFTQYGVRVPAVVVSPLIPKGTLDHTIYDHTSILATLETLYDLPPLTKRDENASNLTPLMSLSTPRTDCPTSIEVPVPAPVETTEPEPAEQAARDAKPLPEKGNIMGFLQIAAKTDYELAGRDPVAGAAIMARVRAIKTYGQAREYFREVRAKLKAYQAARKPRGGGS